MDYSGFTGRLSQYAPGVFKLSGIFLIGLLLFSCKQKKGEEISHQRGEMTIWVDPANKNLIEALTDVYRMKYPEVKFHFVYEPENIILQNLIDLKAEAAFINKPLTQEQSDYIFQESTVKPRSTLLAYDAVIFIAGRESPVESVSMEEIKEAIFSDGDKLVFDDGNSGNFNTVREVLEIELTEGQKVRSLENAEQVIDFVNKSPGSVGVIGMNVISEKSSPRVKEILDKIKILPVRDSSGELREPSVPNLLAFNYPFFKGVYFIVREPGFGIGSGFTRFAGSQQGQLIVGREGLQPNFLYEREIQVNTDPL